MTKSASNLFDYYFYCVKRESSQIEPQFIVKIENGLEAKA